MKKILPKKISYLPIIWELRKLILYFIASIVALWKFKQIYLLWEPIYFFSKWYNTVKRDDNILNYDQPWITFRAILFLDAILQKDMKLWEFGSGSSTLYFAKRVTQVYSVEND